MQQSQTNEHQNTHIESPQVDPPQRRHDQQQHQQQPHPREQQTQTRQQRPTHVRNNQAHQDLPNPSSLHVGGAVAAHRPFHLFFSAPPPRLASHVGPTSLPFQGEPVNYHPPGRVQSSPPPENYSPTGVTTETTSRMSDGSSAATRRGRGGEGGGGPCRQYHFRSLQQMHHQGNSSPPPQLTCPPMLLNHHARPRDPSPLASGFLPPPPPHHHHHHHHHHYHQLSSGFAHTPPGGLGHQISPPPRTPGALLGGHQYRDPIQPQRQPATQRQQVVPMSVRIGTSQPVSVASATNTSSSSASGRTHAAQSHRPLASRHNQHLSPQDVVGFAQHLHAPVGEGGLELHSTYPPQHHLPTPQSLCGSSEQNLSHSIGGGHLDTPGSGLLSLNTSHDNIGPSSSLSQVGAGQASPPHTLLIRRSVPLAVVLPTFSGGMESPTSQCVTSGSNTNSTSLRSVGCAPRSRRVVNMGPLQHTSFPLDAHLQTVIHLKLDVSFNSRVMSACYFDFPVYQLHSPEAFLDMFAPPPGYVPRERSAAVTAATTGPAFAQFVGGRSLASDLSHTEAHETHAIRSDCDDDSTNAFVSSRLPSRFTTNDPPSSPPSHVSHTGPSATFEIRESMMVTSSHTHDVHTTPPAVGVEPEGSFVVARSKFLRNVLKGCRPLLISANTSELRIAFRLKPLNVVPTWAFHELECFAAREGLPEIKAPTNKRVSRAAKDFEFAAHRQRPHHVVRATGEKQSRDFAPVSDMNSSQERSFHGHRSRVVSYHSTSSPASPTDGDALIPLVGSVVLDRLTSHHDTFLHHHQSVLATPPAPPFIQLTSQERIHYTNLAKKYEGKLNCGDECCTLRIPKPADIRRWLPSHCHLAVDLPTALLPTPPATGDAVLGPTTTEPAVATSSAPSLQSGKNNTNGGAGPRHPSAASPTTPPSMRPDIPAFLPATVPHQLAPPSSALTSPSQHSASTHSRRQHQGDSASQGSDQKTEDDVEAVMAALALESSQGTRRASPDVQVTDCHQPFSGLGSSDGNLTLFPSHSLPPPPHTRQQVQQRVLSIPASRRHVTILLGPIQPSFVCAAIPVASPASLQDLAKDTPFDHWFKLVCFNSTSGAETVDPPSVSSSPIGTSAPPFQPHNPLPPDDQPHRSVAAAEKEPFSTFTPKLFSISQLFGRYDRLRTPSNHALSSYPHDLACFPTFVDGRKPVVLLPYHQRLLTSHIVEIIRQESQAAPTEAVGPLPSLPLSSGRGLEAGYGESTTNFSPYKYDPLTAAVLQPLDLLCQLYVSLASPSPSSSSVVGSPPAMTNLALVFIQSRSLPFFEPALRFTPKEYGGPQIPLSRISGPQEVAFPTLSTCANPNALSSAPITVDDSSVSFSDSSTTDRSSRTPTNSPAYQRRLRRQPKRSVQSLLGRSPLLPSLLARFGFPHSSLNEDYLEAASASTAAEASCAATFVVGDDGGSGPIHRRRQSQEEDMDDDYDCMAGNDELGYDAEENHQETKSCNSNDGASSTIHSVRPSPNIFALAGWQPSARDLPTTTGRRANHRISEFAAVGGVSMLSDETDVLPSFTASSGAIEKKAPKQKSSAKSAKQLKSGVADVPAPKAPLLTSTARVEEAIQAFLAFMAQVSEECGTWTLARLNRGDHGADGATATPANHANNTPFEEGGVVGSTHQVEASTSAANKPSSGPSLAAVPDASASALCSPQSGTFIELGGKRKLRAMGMSRQKVAIAIRIRAKAIDLDATEVQMGNVPTGTPPPNPTANVSPSAATKAQTRCDPRGNSENSFVVRFTESGPLEKFIKYVREATCGRYCGFDVVPPPPPSASAVVEDVVLASTVAPSVRTSAPSSSAPPPGLMDPLFWQHTTMPPLQTGTATANISCEDENDKHQDDASAGGTSDVVVGVADDAANATPPAGSGGGGLNSVDELSNAGNPPTSQTIDSPRRNSALTLQTTLCPTQLTALGRGRSNVRMMERMLVGLLQDPHWEVIYDPWHPIMAIRKPEDPSTLSTANTATSPNKRSSRSPSKRSSSGSVLTTTTTTAHAPHGNESEYEPRRDVPESGRGTRRGGLNGGRSDTGDGNSSQRLHHPFRGRSGSLSGISSCSTAMTNEGVLAAVNVPGDKLPTMKHNRGRR